MMNAPSQFRVFDHDPTAMESKAMELGFTKVPTTQSGDARDEEAATSLLSDKNWKLSLVHIDDKPWDRLCREAEAGQVIVRASTRGFERIPPQGTNALCLHSLKTTSEITSADINALRAVLTHEEDDRRDAVHKDVWEGVINERIRHIISLTEPHRLRGLHILLQGVMAVWASIPGSEDQEKAAGLLGVDSMPPLAASRIAERLILQRALGLTLDGVTPECDKAACAALRRAIELEKGCEKDKLDNAVAQLLDDICNNATGEVDTTKVFDAFAFIDAFLRR